VYRRPVAGAHPQYVDFTPCMNSVEPLRLMMLKTMASMYTTNSDVRCRVVLSRKIRTK